MLSTLPAPGAEPVAVTMAAAGGCMVARESFFLEPRTYRHLSLAHVYLVIRLVTSYAFRLCVLGLVLQLWCSTVNNDTIFSALPPLFCVRAVGCYDRLI